MPSTIHLGDWRVPRRQKSSKACTQLFAQRKVFNCCRQQLLHDVFNRNLRQETCRCGTRGSKEYPSWHRDTIAVVPRFRRARSLPASQCSQSPRPWRLPPNAAGESSACGQGLDDCGHLRERGGMHRFASPKLETLAAQTLCLRRKNMLRMMTDSPQISRCPHLSGDEPERLRFAHEQTPMATFLLPVPHANCVELLLKIFQHIGDDDEWNSCALTSGASYANGSSWTTNSACLLARKTRPPWWVAVPDATAS